MVRGLSKVTLWIRKTMLMDHGLNTGRTIRLRWVMWRKWASWSEFYTISLIFCEGIWSVLQPPKCITHKKTGSLDNVVQDFLIGLTIIGYELLYRTRTWRRVPPKVVLYTISLRFFLQNKVEKMYLYFGTFFIKRLSHSPLLDMNEMIVSNSTGLVGHLSSHI